MKQGIARLKDAACTFVSRGPKLYGQSLRTERWRFTLWSDGQTELYDHDHDPEELHDVSGQQVGTVKELTARLQTLPKPTP